MGVFSAVKAAPAKARLPLRVISLPPTAYRDTWPGRPTTDEKVGLRLLGDHDQQMARSTAAKRAFSRHPKGPDVDPGWIEAHNDALLQWAVARGTCKPEDVLMPFFQAAEENVELALTSDGIRYLYEQIEILAIEESPVSATATDADIGDLIEMLQAGTAWGRMPIARAERLRRVLGHAIEELARHEAGPLDVAVGG